MKKIIISAVCIALFLLLTGCSKKDEAKEAAQTRETKETNMKGRYVESNITLPMENCDYNLYEKDGMPFLMAQHFSEDGEVIDGCYLLNPDGTWTDATPKWLKSLKLPSSDPIQFLADADGTEYLYYRVMTTNSDTGKFTFNAYMLRSTDGTTYETFHPKDWTDEVLFTPIKISLLKDGSFAAMYNSGNPVDIYDKTFEKTYSIDGRVINSILSVNENSLILGKKDEIDIYDIDNGNLISSHPISFTLSGDIYLDVSKDGTLALCSKEGVHILEPDTSMWQTIIDGGLTSLSTPTMTNTSFVAGTDGNFYNLFWSQAGWSLKKYSYDDSIDTSPSIELNIFSLKDSPTLRQAAAKLQIDNPDVRVNFTIAMSDAVYDRASTQDKEDFIKSLNTELLAGNGPDIIVLNDLPTESFVEKGVLADISDVILPMIDNGELLPNIMNNYIINDKIFYVPVRYNLPLFISKYSDIARYSNLEALSLDEPEKDTTLLGELSPASIIDVFSPFLFEKVTDDNGNIAKDKLVSVLEELKTIQNKCDNFSHDDSTTDKNTFLATGLAGLVEKNVFTLFPTSGFNSAIFPIGMVDYLKGSYTLFENAFIPSCELGINSASDNMTLSKEFVTLALSEEIQRNDLTDGFPVNASGLTLSSRNKRDNIIMSISTADNLNYSFTAYNKEYEDGLVGLCKLATNRATYDNQLIDSLTDGTIDYFNGTLSAEETADRILEKIKISQSE